MLQPFPFAALAGAAFLAIAAAALAEPSGQTQTVRAERQRVEQLRDDMNAILTCPLSSPVNSTRHL